MKRHIKKLPLTVESIRVLRESQLVQIDGGAPRCTTSATCMSKEPLTTCGAGQC